jgi:hypothetical protein
VKSTHNDFEAPELILIGEAEDVVLGGGLAGTDMRMFASDDFEFEQDS